MAHLRTSIMLTAGHDDHTATRKKHAIASDKTSKITKCGWSASEAGLEYRVVCYGF